MVNNIEFISLKNKFLAFYEASKTVDTVQDKFKIWKEKYGFAAVPPTDDGQKRAFELFETAYANYEESIERIKRFEVDEDKIYRLLENVKETLNYSDSVSFSVIYFVGFFEGNAFVAPNGDKLALCFPIENDNSNLYDEMLLAHELTHIIHHKIRKSNAQWLRPLACLILEEGLAMKVSQAVVPGLSDHQYISSKKEWYKACRDKHRDILKGILPYVKEETSEVLFQFTMGLGTTNHEREAYYAAWALFDRLLEQGFCLSDLARISQETSKIFVEEHIKMIT